MKKRTLQIGFKKTALALSIVFTSIGASAQTNVFDNVIAVSPAHTSLKLALETAFLDDDLQDPMMNYTVFAPTNAAFDAVVADLGLADINALLALPNLADILLYHVLDSEVPASAVTNGLVATPMNTSNSIKFTVDGIDVYANQAPISGFDLPADNGVVHVLDEVILENSTVVDVALGSAVHTSLVAAVVEARLLPALTNPFEKYTVFAPTNTAFDNVVTDLGLADINALLALPTLADILLYHVMNVEVPSSGVTNGLIATPMNTTNSIKFTIDGTDVFANQSPISGFDLPADNGVVHVLDEVILSNPTVADVALGSAVHTSLVAAVVEARLLPALTDPFEKYTVFAPTNTAFDDVVTALGLADINALLALPSLADILLYHVMNAEVPSSGVTNGLIATPMNTTNSIKFTVDGMDVYANQSPISGFDLPADNGVVHVLDEVILSNPTVADVAIGSAVHTSLVAAVVEARLLPALTDPFEKYTVFAPTNTAFDNAVTALGLADINALLASSDLTSILLYHVLGSEVLEADLANGMVPTLNGQSVTVDISGPTINTSNITATDLLADNGVVHVLDAVLVPSLAGIEESQIEILSVYPNPASNVLNINNLKGNYEVVSIYGEVVKSGTLSNNTIDVSELSTGNYFIKLTNNTTVYQAKFIKL